MTALLDRITTDPAQCGGRPCIRSLRIRVEDILEMLANGISAKEILKDFPDLEPDDIRACMAYAETQADNFIARNRDALNASIRLARTQAMEGNVSSRTIDDIIAEGHARHGKP